MHIKNCSKRKEKPSNFNDQITNQNLWYEICFDIDHKTKSKYAQHSVKEKEKWCLNYELTVSGISRSVSSIKLQVTKCTVCVWHRCTSPTIGSKIKMEGRCWPRNTSRKSGTAESQGILSAVLPCQDDITQSRQRHLSIFWATNWERRENG